MDNDDLLCMPCGSLLYNGFYLALRKMSYSWYSRAFTKGYGLLGAEKTQFFVGTTLCKNLESVSR